MIKFEFILTDHEAEDLMYAVHTQITRLQVNIIEEMAGKNRQEYIDGYNASIEYYKALKDKMKNKRVDEEDIDGSIN